jgi:hypothetical protein
MPWISRMLRQWAEGGAPVCGVGLGRRAEDGLVPRLPCPALPRDAPGVVSEEVGGERSHGPMVQHTRPVRCELDAQLLQAVCALHLLKSLRSHHQENRVSR